jgi:exopolysaccharide production protein ExoQ
LSASVSTQATASRPGVFDDVSRPALVAAFVMLMIFSRAWVFPILGEGPDAEEAGGIVRLLYFPGYFIGIGFLMTRLGPVLQALARQPFLLAIMAMVALSTTWSIVPEETLRRAFAFYCTTLCGLVLGVRFRWIQLAELLAGVYATLCVISLVVALAVPSVGVMHELFPGAWRGVWIEKNQFGATMTAACVVLIGTAILSPQRRLIWGGFAALAFFLILMSTSKTALVCLMPGLGALVFVAVARRGAMAGIVSGWFLIIGVMTIAITLTLNSDLFFTLLGKDATFTGRTKIWTALMRQIAERPWTGYGYGVFWHQKGGWGPLAWIIAEAGFKPQHAHNTWLEQLVAMGIFGLVAFSLFFAQTMINCAIAVFRNPGAYLAAPYFAVYTLTTLTESVGAVYNDMDWVIITALAVKLATRERASSA